jgi:hypothetical protein
MALTSRITAQIDATETGTLDLGSKTAKISAAIALALANGTGNDQADVIWSDERTIAASANDDLDLAGSLVGAFGNTLTFAKIKAILVIADDANTNNVVIGAAASAQFVGPFGAATHTIAVRPGGVFLIAIPDTGWTVTATSADLLRIANSAGGTPVTYKLVIVGTSS